MSRNSPPHPPHAFFSFSITLIYIAVEGKVTSEPYDYIIAGGGLAGCVLAERLTADGTKRVLVLEAGGQDFKNLFIRMPAGILRLFRSKYDWQHETGGEKACNGRNLFLQRGKVSSIRYNTMLLTLFLPKKMANIGSSVLLTQ
jgi:choline dehydrogenase-like flavoprotein